MMEQGLYSLLASSLAMQEVLGTPSTRDDGTTGIFPVLLPEATTLPAVVYLTIAANSVTSMDGTNALQSKRVQWDCYGKSYNAAKQLAEAVKAAMLGFRGVVSDGTFIHAVIPNLEMDMFEGAPFTYRVVLDMDVWFASPIT